jgi:hypothetical protein
MRSQSVVKLIAQDCFIFTILQEYVASALSVPLGQYHHFITSAHVFDSDRYTDDYIESEWADVEEAVFPSEGDPDDLDQMVSRIGEAEQAIRQGPPEIATRLIDDLELAAGYETWAVWLRVVHKIFVPHLPVYYQSSTQITLTNSERSPNWYE